MGETGKRKVLRVSEETYEAIVALAEEQDLQLIEIVERLVTAGMAAVTGKAPEMKAAAGESVLAGETIAAIEAFAKTQENMSVTNAAARLIKVGLNRLQALSDYNKAQKAAPRTLRSNKKGE